MVFKMKFVSSVGGEGGGGKRDAFWLTQDWEIDWKTDWLTDRSIEFYQDVYRFYNLWTEIGSRGGVLP